MSILTVNTQPVNTRLWGGSPVVYLDDSPAADWGFEDGLEGKSEFTGYDYFAGLHLQEYFEGHRQGVALRQRLQGVVLTEVKRLAGSSEAAYVPFQQPAEAYADVRPDYEREDWIGA